MAGKFSIYVVDDDAPVRNWICRQLRSTGEFECQAFSSTEDFLKAYPAQSVDCVVADLKMPGRDGIALYEELERIDPLVSIVFISGQADVKTAVKLMQRGALTLLEKPFTPEDVIEAVRQGAVRTRKMRLDEADRLQTAELLATLDEDEQQVLDCIMAGFANRAIAERLLISPRTVDRRRQSILRKMQVNSAAELIALVTQLRNPPR